MSRATLPRPDKPFILAASRLIDHLLIQIEALPAGERRHTARPTAASCEASRRKRGAL